MNGLFGRVLLLCCSVGLQVVQAAAGEDKVNVNEGRVGATGNAVTVVNHIRMAFMFPHNSRLKHIIGDTMEYASTGVMPTLKEQIAYYRL